MRIGLYNLEPQYMNLALEKIRIYHKQKGDEVEDCTPIQANGFDMVYASSIFDFTNKRYVSDSMLKGGTGFDLTTKLPSEIEAIKPHLNRGFTTRGCIRNCSFCVVPRKEGHIHAVGDLLDLWDGKSKEIVLHDNNILALPEHFEMVCRQAIEHKLGLDMNQGLDHRLLTPEIVDLLAVTPHKEYHFAFDHPNMVDSVERAIGLLSAKGIKRSIWYVLAGYNTTFDEDLFRLNYLREHNQNAYLMRYQTKENKRDKKLISLARWANQHHIFHGMDWGQFLRALKSRE